jgi:hypothetical protein
MAYTFLQAMNATLKRVGIIQGDSGNLTDFSDSPRQTDIDVMIQSWNEILNELYKFKEFPQEVASSTITLATGTREYALASDFEGFVESYLTDETNGDRIFEYPGGFRQMTNDQLQPANYTGQPLYFAVSPVNGKVRLDTVPTSDENGNVYTYYYTKRLSLSATTDTFPFSDTVVELLYLPVCEIWNQKRKETFNAGLYSGGMALAQRALYPHEISRHY